MTRLPFPVRSLVALAACKPQLAGTAAEPWTLDEVRPNTADGIRILVLHDMEGLSGRSDP